jgi:KDO2-lipid IV(A) lauroyltransferase
VSARDLLDAALYHALRGLLAAVRLLPRSLTLAACRGFGRSWARLGGPRTGVAETNLEIAFPELGADERRRILLDSFAQLAEHLVDVAEIARLDKDVSEELVRFEGFEHIEAAQRATPEGGAILLTAHFGSFELFAAACAARGIPVSIVHREQGLPAFERLLQELRRSAGIEPLRRGSAARAVLRALRKGRIVAMPLDQDTPRAEGVFVDFFGRPACTRSAPARIAMRTGSPVVPGFLFRRPDGSGHVARFGPAIPLVAAEEAGNDADTAVIENTQRMTRAIEEAIRRAPDHWSWIHRRWRTAPERGVNVYKPSKSR